MGKYLYVEARAWFTRDGVPTDDPLSFDHIIVEAEDVEDAYVVGCVALTKQQEAATDQPTQSHMTGQFLNDYVVKL